MSPRNSQQREKMKGKMISGGVYSYEGLLPKRCWKVHLCIISYRVVHQASRLKDKWKAKIWLQSWGIQYVSRYSQLPTPLNLSRCMSRDIKANLAAALAALETGDTSATIAFKLVSVSRIGNQFDKKRKCSHSTADIAALTTTAEFHLHGLGVLLDITWLINFHLVHNILKNIRAAGRQRC